MRLSAMACTAGLLTAKLLALGCAPADAQVFQSSAGKLAVETIASGLDHPWGVAFLPDGRLLVTERPGRIRIVGKDGKISPALAGVPKVFASGQGGLLDVALDRGYADNHTIYFCYADPVDGGARTSLARAALASEASGQRGNSLEVRALSASEDARKRADDTRPEPGSSARAQLVDEGTPRLADVKVIFRQDGPLSNGRHFGCRIVQTSDGNLFLSMGDHGSFPKEAQNLDNHIGKLIRIRPDGSVPPDNPFVGRTGAKPEIWSYGHRNSQGMALHPATGKLWEQEHGPRGGDEINIVEKGKNYGWPVIGYGIDYSGAKIHEGTQKGGMEQPVWNWVPSIAPSGLAFYTGNLFPAWRGSLFAGALAGQALVRLELDGDKVVKEERLLQQMRERVRDVRQGPDGALWLATDNSPGRILRVAPAK